VLPLFLWYLTVCHICMSAMLFGLPHHFTEKTKFLRRNSTFRDTFRRHQGPTHTHVCTRVRARRWSGKGSRSEHCPPGASLRLLRGCHTPSAFIVRCYVLGQTGNSGRVRCRATRQIGGDAVQIRPATGNTGAKYRLRSQLW